MATALFFCLFFRQLTRFVVPFRQIANTFLINHVSAKPLPAAGNRLPSSRTDTLFPRHR